MTNAIKGGCFMPIMTKPAQADGQTALPPLCDAHTHPGEAAEWLERLENGIISLICASTPPEAEALFTHLKRIEGTDSERNGNSRPSCLIPTASGAASPSPSRSVYSGGSSRSPQRFAGRSSSIPRVRRRGSRAFSWNIPTPISSTGIPVRTAWRTISALAATSPSARMCGGIRPYSMPPKPLRLTAFSSKQTAWPR